MLITLYIVPIIETFIMHPLKKDFVAVVLIKADYYICNLSKL